MQKFPLNIFIATVLRSIWRQVRARQYFLGNTLLSRPVNKENKITYVRAENLKNLPLLRSRFFYPASPIHSQKKSSGRAVKSAASSEQLGVLSKFSLCIHET